MSQPTYYIVNDEADKQAALNAGIPASELVYSGTPNANAGLGNGDQAPTGLSTLPTGATGVYVGNAASHAPVGAQTIAGANRAQTQAQLVASAASAQAQAAQAQQNQLSADAVMHSILDPLGLDSLSQWALNLYAQSGDWNYVSSQLPTTQQFQARFPAWQTWSHEGYTAAQYVQYEDAAYQAAQQEGLPQGFITQSDITNFINNKASTSEITQRLQDATKVVNGLDTNSQEYLAAQELGISKGDLAAYFIDPTKALPLLEQKVAAAQIGGAATNAGINLSPDLALSLSQQGVSQSQALSGFTQMGNDQQLFAPLPGQPGSVADQATQVGAVFGTNPAAAQQLANTAAARKAVFAAGGGISSTSQGFTGAGVSKGA